jgi:hypothetical protein
MSLITKKIIGYFFIIIGISIFIFASNMIYKMSIYPLNGEVKNAKIIGYQSISNETKIIDCKKSLIGINPFFEFISDNNQIKKSYSKSLPFFAFFNYKLGEEVRVSYPKNQPKKAIILSIKELPSIIILYILSFLFIFIGNNFTLK